MGKKRRGRRHTTYKEWITPDSLVTLEGWARDGLVNEQIAQNIGIAESTLYRWLTDHAEIREALKTGKEVVDRHVENALLKRALGYTYTERVFEHGAEVKATVKEVVADTTAQIFWLKNRKPQEWRDRKEVGLAADRRLEDFFIGGDIDGKE